MTSQVLLIEDDDALRVSLTQTLELAGLTVLQANSFAQARRSIRANFDGVLLSDIRMPSKDGFDVLAHSQSVDPELPVVLLTGEADVPMAMRAMRQGAYDFLEKPCATDQLIDVLRRALDFRGLVRQKRLLEQRLHKNDPAAVNFPGDSPASRALRKSLRMVSEQPVHVFLTGDAGAGKRLAAHTIQSLGRDEFNFAEFDFQGVESEGGIDLNLGEEATNLSVRGLGVASTEQVGSLIEVLKKHPKARCIFASDGPILEHSDWINSLEAVKIEVPNLRQRKSDLPVLFETLLGQLVQTLNIETPALSDSVRAQLMAKDWVGNLPELRTFAQSIAMTSDLVERNLEQSLPEQLDAFEALVLAETLRREGGKATAAAQSLGLPRKTFYDRLARYDLRPKDFKN